LYLLLAAFFVLGQSFPFLAHNVLPGHAELVQVLIVASFVSCVIDAYQAAVDFRAAEVVDGEVGAALVFVLKPPEAL
jgi:hypothetical protein